MSLHGTGGAWIVADTDADPHRFRAAVINSLDRKVCNTLNTFCVVASRADELIPVFLDALDRAGCRPLARGYLRTLEGRTGRRRTRQR